MVTAPATGSAAGLAAADAAVLRRELALRIALQNLLLILSLALFTAFAGLALARPDTAWAAAAAHGAVGLGAALQWCHHGVRTKQIKDYLMSMDLGDSGGGWERWLPQNRPPTLLGSRWLISTKWVFLGLQGAAIALALRAPAPVDGSMALVGVALLGASAAFLLTNPKE